MDFKTELSKLLGPKLTKEIKDLTQKFSAAPITQAAPLAPPAPGQPAQADPVQLQEATLTDGTVIKYNTPTLAVGSEVTVVSPEGEMPAPEGELTLQDGTVIKVIKGEGNKSIVESVTPGAGGAPAAPVQQAGAPDLNQKILEIANLLKGFESQLAAEKAENESLKKQVAESNTKFSALEANVGQFIQVFSSVLEIPTAQPIEKPKNKAKSTIEKFIAANTPNP